jgi:hypothetical protein
MTKRKYSLEFRLLWCVIAYMLLMATGSIFWIAPALSYGVYFLIPIVLGMLIIWINIRAQYWWD